MRSESMARVSLYLSLCIYIYIYIYIHVYMFLNNHIHTCIVLCMCLLNPPMGVTAAPPFVWDQRLKNCTGVSKYNDLFRLVMRRVRPRLLDTHALGTCSVSSSRAAWYMCPPGQNGARSYSSTKASQGLLETPFLASRCYLGSNVVWDQHLRHMCRKLRWA